MTKISFLGDISLNDDYNKLYINKENPFSEISNILGQSDYVIGNLECMVAGIHGENKKKKPRLKTNYQTLNYLNNIGLGLVCLANNHVYDNLLDGFKKTKTFLDDNNIRYLGAGLSEKDAQRPFITQLNNQSFCFLNYVTIDTNPSMPSGAEVFINVFNLQRCLQDIVKNKEYDYRVVILHWGGRLEGGRFPDYSQIDISKQIINAGADLIIGHHSHTFQPFEKYKNKYIFYSLGNFCFSDIKFEGRIKKMTTRVLRESAIVQADFEKSNVDAKLFPIVNDKLFLKLKSGLKYKYRIRNFVFFVLKNIPFIWKVYYLKFKYINPILKQIFRKDEKKSLIARIMGLNREKLAKLFNK